MPGSLGKTGLTKSSCLLMLGDGYNTSVVLHMSKSLPFFFFPKSTSCGRIKLCCVQFLPLTSKPGG